MDLNTLGFLMKVNSANEKRFPFLIQAMIFREDTPYYISLGIEEEGQEDDSKCVFLITDQARDLGEKLIFLADLAEKANLESVK
ncbi:MAG: hypothetical protein DYH15_12085 [Nitrosomonas sp. PRO4]|nr:hypothetical protein [Nitrosomonas sp. PRO4]